MLRSDELELWRLWWAVVFLFLEMEGAVEEESSSMAAIVGAQRLQLLILIFLLFLRLLFLSLTL